MNCTSQTSAAVGPLTEEERRELLDWVSACQSSYHIDSTPGHRFAFAGSNLDENREALVDYVNDLLAARMMRAFSGMYDELRKHTSQLRKHTSQAVRQRAREDYENYYHKIAADIGVDQWFRVWQRGYAAALSANLEKEKPVACLMLDKNGEVVNYRSRVHQFFGALLEDGDKNFFDAEDVARADRDAPGLAPHRAIVVYE